MKSERILKSFAELSLDMAEVEAKKATEASLKPSPVDVPPPPQSHLPAPKPDLTRFARYHHWGLNE